MTKCDGSLIGKCDCGGKAVTVAEDGKWFAKCTECGIMLTRNYETEGDAIAIWNSDLKRREISVVDDECMTVVFDRSVVSFDKNPMHIESEFGKVIAVCRGDALVKLDEATREPVVSNPDAAAALSKAILEAHAKWAAEYQGVSHAD